MPGYRVTFTTRDEYGEFKRFSREILADDHDEALQWVIHKGFDVVSWYVETQRVTDKADRQRHFKPF